MKKISFILIISTLILFTVVFVIITGWDFMNFKEDESLVEIKTGDQQQIKEQSAEKIDLLYSMYAGYDAMSLSEDEIEDIFKFAKEDLGLNYLKLGMNWQVLEPQQGNFQWSKHDKIAESAKKYELSIIPFFGQQPTPSWAQKKPSQKTPDCKKGGTFITKDPVYYADYIYEYVQRYKDDMSIKYIELENEPNAECLWSDTGEYLAEVDNAVYEKVKSNYLDINVCSASFHQPLGLGGADLKEENEYTETFLKDYLGNLKKIDCFSLHDYGYTGFTQTNNYKYSSQYDLEKSYREILDSYNMKDVPIIFTECGYAKQIFGYDAAAAHFVQGYILSHAKGFSSGRMCQGISPGILGQAGGNMENYGITDLSKGEYYAGYYAFKTMRNIMLNYPNSLGHIKGEFNDNGYWVEKFGNDKGGKVYVSFVPVIFSGSSNAKLQKVPSQSATINIGIGKTAIVTSMKGEKETKIADGSGNILLMVNIDTVFIEVSND